jgi:predicted ATPase with chaperone activity
MAISGSGKFKSIPKSEDPPRRDTNPLPVTPPTTSAPPASDELHPDLIQHLVEPRTIEETRIPPAVLADLALKILYFGGVMPGGKVAYAMHLHFSGVVEPILRSLKADRLIEVTGGSSLNPASYQYTITNKGGERARELLQRNRYVGPCPVSLRHYVEVVKIQAQNRPLVAEADVRRALEGLILDPETIERIGPAVNSYESIFIYGPPGNGKTSIGKAIGQGLLPGNVMVPHAIFEDGQIIKVFDPETHEVKNGQSDKLPDSSRLDRRWVHCSPPIVITGGELTLHDLDLAWSDTNRFYEAPFQLKANCGMLMIDDFGRQRVEPRDLLNRWIVPLEEGIDFLTFHTGKKFQVPFETLLVFSTNLNPTSLVDEAFLRRITHKLGVDNPDRNQFKTIFVAACQSRGLEFNEEAFTYLLGKYYDEVGRPLRACHPRDLLKQVINFAVFRREPPAMTVNLIDRAASAYFAELF